MKRVRGLLLKYLYKKELSIPRPIPLLIPIDIYDKLDEFNYAIVNFPFLNSK